jgi:uncharacterized membrane protein YtjA (UPF0391 family)
LRPHSFSLPPSSAASASDNHRIVTSLFRQALGDRALPSWNNNAGTPFSLRQDKGEIAMLYYALVFLVVAIIAGVLGFGGIAGASASIAQVLFFLFLVLFAVSLIARVMRRA